MMPKIVGRATWSGGSQSEVVPAPKKLWFNSQLDVINAKREAGDRECEAATPQRRQSDQDRDSGPTRPPRGRARAKIPARACGEDPPTGGTDADEGHLPEAHSPAQPVSTTSEIAIIPKIRIAAARFVLLSERNAGAARSTAATIAATPPLGHPQLRESA